MKDKIIIYIQDNDTFFTKGIKYSLLDYFHQKGSNVIFTHNAASSPPIDFAFISAPLNKKACYCYMLPQANHHNTRFFTIRERRHHGQENLPHCALEQGTLYRQEPCTAIARLLGKAAVTPLTERRAQCKVCSGNRLTRREKEVLSYLCSGASQSETAKQMQLSVKTVNAHKQAMMKKMDLKRKQDFIYWVLKNRHHGASRIE